MPPPPPPSRPAIGTPQFFAGYFQNNSGVGPAQHTGYTSTGYTAAHASWYNERDHWRSQAYAQPRGTNTPLPPGAGMPIFKAPSRSVLDGVLEEVSIMACASWFGEDPRGTAIIVRWFIFYDFCYLNVIRQECEEGCIVPAQATPGEIRGAVISALVPSMQELRPGFRWDFTLMIVREEKLWIDISRCNPSLSYFGSRFMKKKGNAKQPSFQPPKDPIVFRLLIDEQQWQAAEHYHVCSF